VAPAAPATHMFSYTHRPLLHSTGCTFSGQATPGRGAGQTPSMTGRQFTNPAAFATQSLSYWHLYSVPHFTGANERAAMLAQNGL